MTRNNLVVRLFLCVAALGTGTLSAQVSDVRAFAERLEGAPLASRRASAAEARALLGELNSRPLDLETIRAVARLSIAMAEPLSPSGVVPGREEARWRSSAIRALTSMLQRGSTDSWSAEQLERLAAYPRIWAEPSRELILLRRVAAARRPPRTLLLALCGLEVEAGNPADCLRLVERPIPELLSEPERLHLAAGALFALGKDSLAAAAYYSGASSIVDPAASLAYRRELEEIADSSTLADWDNLAAGSARLAWLKRFWGRQDLNDGRFSGTRLAEQFARWRLSLQRYRWDTDGSLATGGIPPIEAAGDANDGAVLFPRDPMTARPVYDARYFARSAILDDRGLLVLRHGAPTAIIGSAGVAGLAQETLVWSVPDATNSNGSHPSIVSFSRNGVNGTPSLHFGMLARNVPVGDLMSICRIDARLCALAGPGDSRVRASLLQQEFSAMRQEAEGSQGNVQSFPTPLHAIVQAFGIPDGGVLVVVAIPVAGLSGGRGNEGSWSEAAVRLRVVIGDPEVGQIVGAQDTIRQWRLTRSPPASAFLSLWTVVPAPVGKWQVAVTVADTEARAGTSRWIAGVPVIRLEDQTLDLGDPILGRAGGGLQWQWGGAPVLLNPSNAWRRSESAELSVVAGGLQAGQEYAVRLEIWPLDRRAVRPHIALEEALHATGTTMLLQRTLSFAELETGDYRLVIRLGRRDGGSLVVRERRIAIR